MSQSVPTQRDSVLVAALRRLERTLRAEPVGTAAALGLAGGALSNSMVVFGVVMGAALLIGRQAAPAEDA